MRWKNTEPDVWDVKTGEYAATVRQGYMLAHWAAYFQDHWIGSGGCSHITDAKRSALDAIARHKAKEAA